jgi:UPF0755 protein
MKVWLIGAVLVVLGLVAWVGARWSESSSDPILYAPETTVTIPEGFTLEQIGERVRETLPHITTEEWEAVVGADSPFEMHTFVLAARKPDDVDMEGYLFPDTYRFFTDASAKDVVLKMIDTMELRLGEVVPATAASPRTVHEILTVASIIEREVMINEDRAIVADIFFRRLEVGMALQADSTVNYVTGKNAPSISNEDRGIDSLWNTYIHPGLPPSPIANPGLTSIQAVFEPEANDFWFFLTDADGVAHYARTNDEHNANKATYLR